MTSPEMSFEPSRLEVAKMRRGLSVKELAKRVALDRRTLHNYLRGETVPSEEQLAQLSAVLRFPAEFFDGEFVDVPSVDTTRFRAASKMTARQRDSALATGSLAGLFSDWLAACLDVPAPAVPDYGDQSPEEAADTLRTEWHLGDRPIANMVHLLEFHGVHVFSLVAEAAEVDAFSTWRGSRPLVFLNTDKSAERCRFDSAHELGHLVLHQAARGHSRELEQEANEFASAFLMPRSGMLRYAPRAQTLAAANVGKQRWGVALTAFLVRLHRIGHLSEWKYRKLMIQATQRGFRKSEPAPRRQHETSQLLRKALIALRPARRGVRHIAHELALHPQDLEMLMFGLAPVLT